MNKKSITPEEKLLRGERVKTARLLAKLSRRELEDKYNVPANTVQAWEIGKNPLTPKGAKRLIEAFRNAGLQVTSDWLLYGAGLPPHSLTTYLESFCEVENIAYNLEEEEAIQREIQTFRDLNSKSTVIIVIDDSMEPYYSIGDYVGGRRYFDDDINKLIGMFCIIETVDNQVYLRQLIEGTEKNFYSAVCINPKTKSTPFTLHNIEIVSAAPVVWTRKRSSLLIMNT